MAQDAENGTASADAEAQSTETTETPAPDAGTQAKDEVTLLKSRAAGLDAKVTELTKAAKAAKAAEEAALAKLSDYELGKVQGDEALRTQLAAKEAEVAQVRTEAKLARIEAKYPETFGVLGAAASALTDDQLAANEARLAGVETGTPGTQGANPARSQNSATKAIADMSPAELRVHLASFSPEEMFAQRQ
jgi:hypothetical protein